MSSDWSISYDNEDYRAVSDWHFRHKRSGTRKKHPELYARVENAILRERGLIEGGVTEAEFAELAQAITPPYDSPPQDEYLPADSPKVLAKRLQIGYTTLKRWIDDGKIRRIIETQRRWRLHRGDVEKMCGKIN